MTIDSPTNFTTEQVNEISRCMQEPQYFIENYCKVQHPTNGAISFKVEDLQQRAIQSYQITNTIVLTPRKIGTSTCTCAYVLWNAMFNARTTALLVSDTHENAIELMNKIHFMHNNLPVWMQTPVAHDTKNTIRFTNGSEITASRCTEFAGRGKTISLLYCDNFAYVNPAVAEAFWISIYPVMQYGRIIITSAPNGTDNIFSRLWHDPQESNKFNHIMFNWDDWPGRTQEYKDHVKITMSEELYQQEYQCLFQ